MSGQLTKIDRRGPPQTTRRTSYLAQSIKLEEGSSPRLLRLTIFTMVLAIAAGVVWASLAKLDQVARADGAVIPSSSVRVLQHLEGGIIEEIAIREGDFVHAGDLVMRFRPIGAESELAQLRAREASLAVRLERLTAFAEEREPDFGAFELTYPVLVGEQRRLMAANIQSRKTQLRLFDKQLQEAKTEVDGLLEQRKTVEEGIGLIEEEVKLREDLMKKGLTRRFTYLDSLRDLNRNRGQLIQMESLISRARQDISETETKIISYKNNSISQTLAEVTTVAAELAEVRETMTRFVDRVDRLILRAPVDGWVQRLIFPTVGGVVSPGASVAEIVPVGDDLVVEVLLNPKDRAFVDLGQAATVRFTAFDFAQFGAMEGVVDNISPTTITTENGRNFYKVVVLLADTYFGNDPSQNLIRPGMVVQADIRTGKRTLMQYLTKPISRALSTGFTER